MTSEADRIRARRNGAAYRRVAKRYPGEYQVMYALISLDFTISRHAIQKRTLRAVANNHPVELRRVRESLQLEVELPRGQQSQPGEKRISANGYHYTRTETEWRLTHHLIAEEHLGRPLSPNEMVLFIGSKDDLRWENIRVVKKGTASARRKLAKIEADITELTAQRDILRKELGLDED